MTEWTKNREQYESSDEQSQEQQKPKIFKYRVEKDKYIEINRSHNNRRQKASALLEISKGLFGRRRFANIYLVSSLNNFYNSLRIANILQKKVENLALIFSMTQVEYIEYINQDSEGELKKQSNFVIKMTRQPTVEDRKSGGYNQGMKKIQNPLTQVLKVLKMRSDQPSKPQNQPKRRQKKLSRRHKKLNRTSSSSSSDQSQVAHYATRQKNMFNKQYEIQSKQRQNPLFSHPMFQLEKQSASNVSQKTNKFEFKDVKCQMGNQCMLICRSHNCQVPGFVCADKKCDCRLKHKRLCTWIDPESIVQMIEQKKKSNQNIVKKVQQKFDSLIDYISEQRVKIVEQMQNINLSQIEAKLMKNVEQNKLNILNGKFISKVLDKLDETQTKKANFETLLSSTFDKQWKQLFYGCKEGFKSVSRMLQSIKTQDLKKIQVQHQTIPKIDSKILTGSEQIERMMNLFNKQKKIKHFKLLYRASENNFRISRFKENCDGVPHTITLIKTTHNKIIGGYTPLRWKKRYNQQYSADQSGQSFVFSITENAKFNLKKDKCKEAIYHSKCQGPSFGFPDLCIYDQSNLNHQSIADIGHHYINNKFKAQVSDTWVKFTGNKKNCRFSTLQWEVHEVIW